MPFRICKVFEIESGHLLSKHAGNCRFPHGHSRRVELVVAADALDANDMVIDFKVLKGVLQALVERWDHAVCVNTDDPQFAYLQQTYGPRVVPFAGTDPTSEVMARVVFTEAARCLAELAATSGPHASGLRVERVRVTETSSSWAEYFA